MIFSFKREVLHLTVLPFISLGAGTVLGLLIKYPQFQKLADIISTTALVLLMLCIGIGIGIDESVVREFPKIGANCIVIALSAIFFSVLLTFICEKTVLSLENYSSSSDHMDTPDVDSNHPASHLVWLMPACLIAGLITGIIMRSTISSSFTNAAFTIALIILYVCVGISQGSNKKVFHNLRTLGFRILWLPFAILVGSITGGFFSSLFLDIPMEIPVVSACGMSFYSITGAYMTQTYGLAPGAYGFIVNLLREFITVLIMPLLIRISPGSPIAGGAAGDMDTMLAPVTKFVGINLSIVTLLTGTVLTFIVPILLPIMSNFIITL